MTYGNFLIINDHKCQFGGGISGNGSVVLQKSYIEGYRDFELDGVIVNKITIEGNNTVYGYENNFDNADVSVSIGFKQEPPVIINYGKCMLNSFSIKVVDGARGGKTEHDIFCCETLYIKNGISEDGVKMDTAIKKYDDKQCVALTHYARSEDAWPISLIVAVSILCVSVFVLIIVIIWAVVTLRKKKQIVIDESTPTNKQLID